MANTSGCGHTRYGFVIILAVLALVIWLIVRFTGQGRATTD
jgi:hypothetical protein